jgi:hypothetical protein
MDKTACRYCHRVGFIRAETVIKGGTSHKSFYCGSCNKTWEINQDGHPQDNPHERRADDRPDRSRTPG